jgi:hypothetical protein
MLESKRTEQHDYSVDIISSSHQENGVEDAPPNSVASSFKYLPSLNNKRFLSLARLSSVGFGLVAMISLVDAT